MIRHPLLRAVQAAAASAASALALVHAAPAAAVGFTLAAVGERERPDGSWEGVDLLRDPSRAVDRFQLTLASDTDARALVEAQSPGGGWDRLYAGTLAGHRAYALPAPHAFFGVQGEARVRITLSRFHAPAGAVISAVPGAIESGPPLPLSDGAPFRAGRARFNGQRAAQLEISLRGR